MGLKSLALACFLICLLFAPVNEKQYLIIRDAITLIMVAATKNGEEKK